MAAPRELLQLKANSQNGYILDEFKKRYEASGHRNAVDFLGTLLDVSPDQANSLASQQETIASQQETIASQQRTIAQQQQVIGNLNRLVEQLNKTLGTFLNALDDSEDE
jgi:uncharacterized coiled-coil protein SlyX